MVDRSCGSGPPSWVCEQQHRRSESCANTCCYANSCRYANVACESRTTAFPLLVCERSCGHASDSHGIKDRCTHAVILWVVQPGDPTSETSFPCVQSYNGAIDDGLPRGALLQGSTKLCSCTAREGGPPAASSSGVAMMVISSKLFWKLPSSLRARLVALQPVPVLKGETGVRQLSACLRLCSMP